MKKSGFTLIELLVVITIIAILAGIALPVFQRAQEKARATQDLNNLKQIGVGIIGYLSDNSDYMPAAGQGFASINERLGGVTDSSTTSPTISAVSKTFVSPFDNRAITSNPVSYGFNSNLFDKDMGTATSLSSLIAVAGAPEQDGKSNLTFSGTASKPKAWLSDLTLTPGTPGGTHSSRRQINALFGDGHVESVAWAKFAVKTGTEGLRRWELVPQT